MERVHRSICTRKWRNTSVLIIPRKQKMNKAVIITLVIANVFLSIAYVTEVSKNRIDPVIHALDRMECTARAANDHNDWENLPVTFAYHAKVSYYSLSFSNVRCQIPKEKK